MSDFIEKTLEDIVFENKETICERGFPFLLDHTFRQFYLPSKRKIDLFSYSINEQSFSCRIFELKRECLMPKHILQVLEYALEIFYNLKPYYDVHIEKFIIGNDIDKPTAALIEDKLDFEAYTYRYCYNGLFFKKYLSTLDIINMNPPLINRLFQPTEETQIFKQRIEALTKQ